MTKKIKTVRVLLISLIIFSVMSSGNINASAHAPNYVDIKYYDQDEVLSIYITHGVSDYEYHYVDQVIIELYELPESLIEEFTTNPDYIIKSTNEKDQEAEENLFGGKYGIQEADVFDVFSLEDNLPFETYIHDYDNQETHQVFHYNYSLSISEWTLVVVTAVCRLEGQRSQSLLTGHPWYDPPHNMIEAVVPATICAIIVLTPLAILRIFGKKPEEVKH